MKNKKFSLSSLYLVLVFVILYLPLIYLVVFSFNENNTMTAFSGFTLDRYRAVFEDTRLVAIAIDTIVLALTSSLVASIIGTGGALLIYYLKSKKLKDLVLSLNNILLVMPDVMIGASFLVLFTFLLPIGFGFRTVFLSHVAFSVPIVVLMVLPRLYALNPNMMRAAEDLGASDWQVLNKIILPNIFGGILAGFFMALSYSLDDFAVSFFVTGGGYTTLSIEVYSRARAGISLEINALSTLMLGLSLVLALGYYLIQKREGRFNE